MTLVRPRLLLGIAAAGALAWAAYAGAQSLYAGRLDPLETSIASLRTYLDGAAAERPKHRRVLEEIDAVVARTLGGDLETVDHQLRSRLNRLGEALALDALVVNTGRHSARETPARSQLRRPEERAVRDEIDFVELEGTLSGEGSLEQVLRLVHEVDAAPWIKRLDVLRIDPRQGGERLAVSLRLTTLFLPGRAPADPPAESLDSEGFDPYLALVHRSPFVLPPPDEPPAPAPPEPVAAPAPPAYDYGRWTITGVVEVGGSAEVWLRDGRSGETRLLTPGQTLEEITLTAVRGDSAVFTAGASTFVVGLGRTLADRRPE